MTISDSLVQIIAAHLNASGGWGEFIQRYEGDKSDPMYLNLLKLRDAEIDLQQIANTRGKLQEK